MELISKEEAKRKIIEELDSIDHVPSWVFKRLEKAIDSLPAVEERKEGKWVRITQDVGLRPHQYKCSECHRVIEYSSSELPCLLEIKFPYCHCGAKMRGE